MIQDVTRTDTTTTSHTSRWRIAVVGAVVILAVAIGAVLGMTLSGRTGAALGPAAAYTPADTVIYLEADLDLGEAQRANLRGLIERIPGADADQVLGEALATTLDDALASAPFDYSTDIAPWFDGQVAVAVLDIPSTDLSTDVTNPQPPDAVFFFGTRDAAAATQVADTVRSSIVDQGGSFSSTQVDGVTVWSLQDTSASFGGDFSYAVTDDQLMLATGADTLSTALDVHAGNADSLAQRDEVRSLSGHLPDGAPALMTVDLASMLADTRDAVAAQMPELGDAYDQLLADTPTFMMGSLSFEEDAFRFDAVTPPPTGDLAVSNATRDLAGQVPADAILYSEGSNVGTRLASMVTSVQAALAASGMDQATVDQIEGALGASLEDYVSWIGDAAMVAGYDGEQPYLGFVLEATDADAAAQRMHQLSALAELATFDSSSGVTVTTDTVAGIEVTTLRLTFAGFPAFDASGSPPPLAVQWAVDGDRVLLGFGDRFVGRVLQLDEADSLGATDRFTAARDRSPGANAGTMFLDLAGLRDALASAVGSNAMGFDQVDPVLSAFDYVVSDSRLDGDVVVDRLSVVMK